MPPRTKGAAAWRACLWSALVLGPARTARANDVSDELTVGTLSPSTSSSSSTRVSSEPFVSDRLGGALDASDNVSLSLDGTLTRYLHANHEPGETIFQIATALDYDGDHWSFGIDARGSPRSTAVTRTDSGPVRSRTSLLGAGAFIEYDSAGESDEKSSGGIDPETIVEGSGGVTEYWTTQRARHGGSSPSSLTQFRLSLGVTEVLWRDTEGALFANWYTYSTDPLNTGYYGASVFGRESVSDGLPLEPLRWSIRPSLRQRMGPVKVSAYFQYGRYVGDAGSNVLGGLKAQIKVSQVLKLWASGGLQHDVQSTGETLLVPWAAVGARVTF